MANKFVYLFSEGNGSMRELLGGKGANLAEMTNLGMPVPQGFTITPKPAPSTMRTARRSTTRSRPRSWSTSPTMEEITGKKFGDLENPLLVSVRSGARASMPGMMDTILNLGLNEDVVEVIAKKSNNPAGLGTATAASSRCTLTSSWKWARSTSRSSSTR